MVILGFLNNENVPTPEAAQGLPSDLETPTSNHISKTIIFFMMNLHFKLVIKKEHNGGKDDHMFVPQRYCHYGIRFYI